LGLEIGGLNAKAVLRLILEPVVASTTICDFRSIGSGMGVADGAGVALATSGTAGTGVRALQAAKTKESERRAMNKRMSFR
jgi:hypothetical protein